MVHHKQAIQVQNNILHGALKSCFQHLATGNPTQTQSRTQMFSTKQLCLIPREGTASLLQNEHVHRRDENVSSRECNRNAASQHIVFKSYGSSSDAWIWTQKWHKYMNANAQAPRQRRRKGRDMWNETAPCREQTEWKTQKFGEGLVASEHNGLEIGHSCNMPLLSVLTTGRNRSSDLTGIRPAPQCHAHTAWATGGET